MSLIDLKLEFSDKQAVTGTSATSTNILDLGLEVNNISGNVHGGGYLNVQCCKDITPAGEIASGTVTFSANPDANDTLKIDDTTITFVASTPSDGEVLIGDTVAETIENVLAVDFGDNVELTKTGTTEITVSAVAKGTAGNSIALVKSSDAITVSGATLSGGVASNTVTVKLQDSDDNSNFADVVGGELKLIDATKGTQGCLRVPTVKRYVRVAYAATTSLTDGKWDAYIGAPISKH